ncbi:50S ribosomal protein L24 [Candidatus Jorgensenbacteria bacterium GWA1_54_12]|uniref:Large ribosomal subunit protein uL24 n=1 Tax=Candidatus Jorgensenbacteria bacterium GWA1_54_12 TaxID=1798468 RepID=A0A1F6BL45_9BACT|nr:MAG: 50S ribosomal protein L24 [Candidatus Jorgensenbacteria bacterium GWA1_54_12]
MRIKKGDNVRVMTGKDKGKEGKVARAMPSRGFVVIEGINVFKKHARPKRQGEKGEIIDVVRPLPASNVRILCPACGPTRIAMKMDGKNKSRICRKCGKAL